MHAFGRKHESFVPVVRVRQLRFDCMIGIHQPAIKVVSRTAHPTRARTCIAQNRRGFDGPDQFRGRLFEIRVDRQGKSRRTGETAARAKQGPRTVSPGILTLGLEAAVAVVFGDEELMEVRSWNRTALPARGTACGYASD